MGKYAVNASNFTTTTSQKTAIQLIGATGKSAEVVEAIMTGSGLAAPADIAHQAKLVTCTAATAGTPGSSPTPEVMRQGGRAANLTAGINYTAEPTVLGTVSPVQFGFNQRGGMRWAVPRGEGERIQGDLTVKALAWTVISQAAGAVDSNLQWWEDL